MENIKFTPITRRMLDMTPEQLSACVTELSTGEFSDMLAELDAAQRRTLEAAAVVLKEIEEHEQGITNGHGMQVKAVFLEGLRDLIARFDALAAAVSAIRTQVDDLPEFTAPADATPLELSFGRVTVMRLGTETDLGTDLPGHVNPHTLGACETEVVRAVGLGLLGGLLVTLGWTMMPALLAAVLIGLGLLAVQALEIEREPLKPHPDRQW